MVGPERDRSREIGRELRRRLAGDAVDEVDREVLEAGVAEVAERALDVRRRRAALEHFEEVQLEGLRAE